MSQNQIPDVDKKMLSLTALSVIIGVIGLIAAVVLGLLQLRGSNQAPPQPEIRIIHDSTGEHVTQPVTQPGTVTTIIKHEYVKSGGKEASSTGKTTTTGSGAASAGAASTGAAGSATGTASGATGTATGGGTKPGGILRPRFPIHLRPGIITATTTGGTGSTSTGPVRIHIPAGGLRHINP